MIHKGGKILTVMVMSVVHALCILYQKNFYFLKIFVKYVVINKNWKWQHRFHINDQISIFNSKQNNISGDVSEWHIVHHKNKIQT